jgi:heme/copper-type cytochrome/quinol oxidase subunit 1
MLPAKLFSALGVVFAILAGLARLRPPLLRVEVPVHSTYFVLGPVIVLLFWAATSLNFAVLYYATVRFFHGRWNRTLSVLHFSLLVCSCISLSAVFAMSTRPASGPDIGEATLRWLIIPWILGILSLVACLVVFGVNLTLVVVQIVRGRFATH